jgi:signal transduction histidine kinase
MNEGKRPSVSGPRMSSAPRTLASLIVATLSTALLFALQVVAVRESAARARAGLEASLDLHLAELVHEARRDVLERAGHITHSVGHRVIRSRDLPGIAETFARARRRHPEARDFVAVFFPAGDEEAPWRVLRYVPAPGEATGEAAIGSFFEDPDETAAIRHAWFSIPERQANTVHAAFVPLAPRDPRRHQVFFHPVYELDSLDRAGAQRRVGLILFTAEPDRFPEAGYFERLVERHGSATGPAAAVGPLVHRVLWPAGGGAGTTLVSTGEAADRFRERGFPPEERIFPPLRFGVAPGAETLERAALRQARPSVSLGLSTGALALLGVGLTLRATVRERRIARLKSDFLASVSHELKTPLTAIRALGDLLRTGRVRDNEKVRQYGELIAGEGERLTALVNDILETSRLERGLRPFRIEPRDLPAVVGRAVELFRGAVVAQGFEVALEPGPALAVPVDEDAVRQAILNLLSNAAKYSGGSRRIEVSIPHRDREAGVRVRDFGVGIPASEQRRVFDPFYRVAGRGASETSGAGLGLTIVKEIARAHGGWVEVESLAGRGATFTLWLPSGEPEPPPEPAEAVA